jgi:CRISPR system Cascade subunit CasE
MYLSLLEINPRSRSARRDLADRYELHRTVMSAFPDGLPEAERVLYRVEITRHAPVQRLIVQSQEEPDWERPSRLAIADYLQSPPQVRPIAPAPEAGARLMFRLQANPTVKRDGKRSAIYSDEALMAWLMRKGTQHGFRVGETDARVAKLGRVYGQGRRQTWHAVQYDGVLTVTDASALQDALMDGLGSAKAFGFGLLSIPYPRA